MPRKLADDVEIARCKENRFQIKVFHVAFGKLVKSTQINFGNKNNLHVNFPCFKRR